jgi:hypothetical protein
VVRHIDDDPSTIPGIERIELNDQVVLDVKMGATNEDALAAMDFDVEGMVREIRKRHVAAETTLGEAWNLGLLNAYPYLTHT